MAISCFAKYETAKLSSKCSSWDNAISVCDVLRPFEIRDARGLNLVLLNLTRFVALKEGKVEQFRTIRVYVRLDAFAEARADNVTTKTGKKLWGNQQGTADRLSFAAAGHLPPLRNLAEGGSDAGVAFVAGEAEVDEPLAI
jgi:hypothetical protein